MRISFDLDGVLYDWHRSIYNYFVNFHGYKNTYENFWTEHDALYSNFAWENLIRIPILYENHFPNENDLEYVKLLSRDNEIFYITSSPKELKRIRGNWLKRFNFPHYENLIVCRDKLIPIVKNEIDVHVDDFTRHIRAIKNFTLGVLFEQPWNKNDRNGFICIKNLRELDSILEGVSCGTRTKLERRIRELT